MLTVQLKSVLGGTDGTGVGVTGVMGGVTGVTGGVVGVTVGVGVLGGVVVAITVPLFAIVEVTF